MVISLRNILQPTKAPHILLALFLAVTLAGTVLIALGFEHIGGYLPCELCLEERVPYYIGAPLMFLAALGALWRAPGVVVRLLFLCVAVVMLYNMGLSIYHAGAEWKFWPGPSGCSGGTFFPADTTSLLDSLNHVKPPACDVAAGRFLGLSFAGWNGVASLGFALLAAFGAFVSFRKN